MTGNDHPQNVFKISNILQIQDKEISCHLFADFEDIVRMVFAGHPITPPTPGAPPVVVPRVVDMFYALCAMLSKTTQHNILLKLR
ncbi:hypothetical protein RHSIM_Rhsim07G0231900 [Rhododendron simsii]|uniref:Uncharacterized protein n=1 Tax=Rhododendron simsii TaxID=118357 RepID=A0A834GJW6_RHOSS|nr:hypothetical protein RHSIM_Rhsim07G0231900 [Rhododendron simsii]